jgi:ADP-ribose pyrophosphatase YjhB (NUDIX family)
MIKLMTLGLIVQDNSILLGMKKRSLGKGNWNGFGGKVEAGETIENAMKREFFEECGVKVNASEQIGVLNFHTQGTDEILQVHIFKVKEYLGNPVETDEMTPKWFKLSEIPFTQMWADDAHWMPLFLKEQKFTGDFYFDEKFKIINFDIKKVNEIKI